MRFGRIGSILALIPVLALTAMPLRAQSVTGVVRDGRTGEPVADASVTLLDKNGRVQRGTLTEPDGTFVLVAPEKGSYSLRIGAMGFATRDTPPLKIESDAVAPLEILLRSEDAGGPLAGFEERRAKGEGIFLTTEDVSKHSGSRFTDILNFTPGVSIIPLPESDRLASWTSSEGQSTRIGRRDDLRPSGTFDYKTVRIKANADFRSNVSGTVMPGELANDCPPVLWVDGIWWGSIDEASEVGPDGALVPGDIAAIEVYNHSTVLPEQFDSGRDALCGVIVVWKKEPG